MGKWVSTDVLDGALAVISSASRMVAVSGQPATYAAAISARLAIASLSNVDFSVTSGPGGSRRVTIAGKDEVGVEQEGTADHVALVDDAGERLLYITTCPPQTLTSGGNVNFGAWTIDVGSPA